MIWYRLIDHMYPVLKYDKRLIIDNITWSIFHCYVLWKFQRNGCTSNGITFLNILKGTKFVIYWTASWHIWWNVSIYLWKQNVSVTPFSLFHSPSTTTHMSIFGFYGFWENVLYLILQNPISTCIKGMCDCVAIKNFP